MARRSGGTSSKCVEEKRRQLPIYQHYTLSPGKTKSHHPEAKCIHCLKEFVCGSKQRLIRHIRKCNSISNADQIVAETLNTLARNSATGQLNNSILEASNLLPSQISHIQHSATQQLVGQAIHQNSTTVTTTNNNTNNSNGNINTSGTSGDSLVVTSTPLGDAALPAMKKPSKRGRKPGSLGSMGPAIHVTTGIDGKTHFTPASQLPHGSMQGSPHLISPAHNGRAAHVGYSYQAVIASSASPATTITASGAHINATNSGHVACATPNHHSSPFKLNTELIDKAYLKLVLTRNLPISLCNTKEFHTWVKTFANDYKPPSSINLIANLKQEAQSARQRVSNILVKTSKKTINLELHCLPDELRGHLWYTMIAGVDHRRFMVSVRDISSIMNQHAQNQTSSTTPDKILNDFIDDCIKRVGSDRVNSLILTGKSDADSIISKACGSLYTSHPSIVAYNCWWHFTNLLCSDVITHNENFGNVVRNSNLLINYISKRPPLSSCLEKFSPFIGAPATIHRKRSDNRWYSHLICYLLDYIKNNSEAIKKSMEKYCSSKFFSDNNNNNNNESHTNENSHTNAQQNSNFGTQQTTHVFYREDPQLVRIKSLVKSDDYWTNLSTALVYLRPIRDIVALAQNMSSNININCRSNSGDQVTPAISPITCNNLSLSDYMHWLLIYGKALIDSWRLSADSNKYQLIMRFLQRFTESIDDFKLLFAAYLLNPKHRCAYMTQRAKDSAIEEILNIASEFMPEESDGHTIFDQWKLYLIREQPYDMVFDENRSNPLDWWMSIPCAESIRRVAIRILRLKAFSSPKPETLFSQLYFYEDETKSTLAESIFEDVAILRYFYDHEDKIGHPGMHSSSHNYTNSTFNQANNPQVSNGFCDRAQVGQIHNDYLEETSNPDKLVPPGPLEITDSNGTYNDSTKMNEYLPHAADAYSHVVGTYNINSSSSLGNHSSLNSVNVTLESLPGYDQFSLYVDFNDTGVQIVEEPIEKKRRKWTAQEILSKVQPNHHNNNHEIERK